MRTKWQAQITFRGKTYFLGAYEMIEDAVAARKRGEEMHDQFLEWYYTTVQPAENTSRRRTQTASAETMNIRNQ